MCEFLNTQRGKDHLERVAEAQSRLLASSSSSLLPRHPILSKALFDVMRSSSSKLLHPDHTPSLVAVYLSFVSTEALLGFKLPTLQNPPWYSASHPPHPLRAICDTKRVWPSFPTYTQHTGLLQTKQAASSQAMGDSGLVQDVHKGHRPRQAGAKV